MAAILLQDAIDSFNLQNHVQFSTHQADHTLDLIITDCDNSSFINVSKVDLFSDHCFLNFDILIPGVKNRRETVISRNISRINKNTFSSDLKDFASSFDMTTSVSELTCSYNDGITTILNKHAPIVERTIKT